jgi:hypothetical protein
MGNGILLGREDRSGTVTSRAPQPPSGAHA